MKLKTGDGHLIYGILNVPKRQSARLIVFVNGLTGHKNEHIFYNAARFFSRHGLNTFRFDLYTGEKGGRLLSSCSVRTHAADLDTVLRHFRKKFNNISVVGHSLGGPTILCANTRLMDSIVLWDSSDMASLDDVTDGQERKLRYNKSLHAYIFDWGTEFVMSKKMAREFGSLNPVNLVRNIHKPLKVIYAEKGNVSAGKNYFKMANSPKDLVMIKRAGHTFDEEGTEERLFQESLKWIKKF